MDDLHHGFGDLGFDLLAQLQNDLRALPVQLLDGGKVGSLESFPKKLLELRILAIRSVSR